MIKSVRWAGHIVHSGDMPDACKIYVGKPEAEITRRSRRIWEDNIKICLKEKVGILYTGLSASRNQWMTLDHVVSYFRARWLVSWSLIIDIQELSLQCINQGLTLLRRASRY